MAKPTSPEIAEPCQAWKRLAAKHPGNPHLAHDPLYTFSVGLLPAIQKVIPDFFTPEDLRFEEDLAAEDDSGFFLGQPLGHPLGPPPEFDGYEWKAKNALFWGLGERGKPYKDADLAAYWTAFRASRGQVRERQQAYAGWLVTNPDYLREQRSLRKGLEQIVRCRGGIPPLRKKYDPMEDHPLRPEYLLDHLLNFYRRWGLECLRTWDWPVPLDPVLNATATDDIRIYGDSALVQVVPWYLLKGGKLDFKNVLEQTRTVGTPTHLDDWMGKGEASKGSDFGDIRYGKLFYLYLNYHLLLHGRYRARCAGKLEKLDAAFASHLEESVESIRKLRFDLRRRLQLASKS